MQSTADPNEEVYEAVAPYLEMPKNMYREDRAFYFVQCAELFDMREVELRVRLSNLFVWMSKRGLCG